MEINMENPRPQSDEDKIKTKEKEILKILRKAAPKVSFEIADKKITKKLNDKLIYIEGSYIHPSGLKLSAITSVPIPEDTNAWKGILQEMAHGYEADRQKKENMTPEEINGTK